jgi:formate hydrogenlyase subunit 4
MSGWLVEVFETLLALALAPGVAGLVRWLKARLQSRSGAPPWQPYRELRKLFLKEVVVSENASWLFRVAPYAVFASLSAIAFLVPVVVVPHRFDAIGDLFVVVYLLLFGTFWLALGGLDPGSAFGGMGSSRDVTVAALAEPTTATAIFALALGAGSTNLGAIVVATLNEPWAVLTPGHLLAFAALFIVAVAEAGRLPVDNPSTHLELTMIHEAMVLEYSGRYLALLEWAACLKLFLFLVLLANLFFPWGIATTPAFGALAWAAITLFFKLALLVAVLAVMETRVAKLRLFRVPELLTTSFLLALLAITSSFFSR